MADPGVGALSPPIVGLYKHFDAGKEKA